jgi:endonuclease/exonuclease/phosphatase family metal-dependent hydrolase
MRLLSYNIHKGIGGRDRRYRWQRIVDVIEREAPDIVCLQEVDHGVKRSRFDHQEKLLVELLHPADWMYQLNVRLKNGGYGNLVLSRWKFLEQHQISLRKGRRKPRGAQLAVVETPEGPLSVVHWHLGLSESERRWQVSHALQHHLFKGLEHWPTILIGDSNDWRNVLDKQVLRALDFHQVTAPPSRFRSFPAWLPLGSLDKAFQRGVHIRSARIVRSPLAHAASDHLPLVVDFHLPPILSARWRTHEP